MQEKLNSINNLEFDSLEFGDIVIARRPNSNIEGHMYGPYIVINIDGNDAYLMYGTTQEQYDIKRYFCLDSNKYCMGDKIGYFNYFITKMDKNNIIYKRSSLTKEDKDYIKKKLAIRNKFIEESLIDVGDIIETRKNKYVVIDFQEDCLCCLKIQCKYGRNAINSNGNYYIVDYSSIVKIPRGDYLQRDTLTPEVTKMVLSKAKESIVNNKRYDVSINRGNLIFKDGSLYFVYEVNNAIFAFEVYDKKFKINSNYEITINNKLYKTNFKLIKFDINSSSFCLQ